LEDKNFIVHEKSGCSDGSLWLLGGIGAAQKAAVKPSDGKSADSKSTDRRHYIISIVVGILLALLIAAGLLILLVSYY
jgi:hypothetical protein